MEHDRSPTSISVLKEHAVNRGEIDHLALIEGRPQGIDVNQQGKFQLFRIGDAVASRNIHASIYDALRLAREFEEIAKTISDKYGLIRSGWQSLATGLVICFQLRAYRRFDL